MCPIIAGDLLHICPKFLLKMWLRIQITIRNLFFFQFYIQASFMFCLNKSMWYYLWSLSCIRQNLWYLPYGIVTRFSFSFIKSYSNMGADILKIPPLRFYFSIFLFVSLYYFAVGNKIQIYAICNIKVKNKILKATNK